MATHFCVLAWETPQARKLNIQKTKIMASGPITSWEVDFWALESLQMVTAAMS